MDCRRAGDEGQDVTGAQAHVERAGPLFLNPPAAGSWAVLSERSTRPRRQRDVVIGRQVGRGELRVRPRMGLGLLRLELAR